MTHIIVRRVASTKDLEDRRDLAAVHKLQVTTCTHGNWGAEPPVHGAWVAQPLEDAGGCGGGAQHPAFSWNNIQIHTLAINDTLIDTIVFRRLPLLQSLTCADNKGTESTSLHHPNQKRWPCPGLWTFLADWHCLKGVLPKALQT